MEENSAYSYRAIINLFRRFILHHFRWDSLFIEKSANTVIYLYWLIGLVGRVFGNAPGDLGSIPGRVITNILKIVLA